MRLSTQEEHAPQGDLMIALQYDFSEPQLLTEALTHASFRNEHKELSYDNERMEFLGDSVLGAVISHMLVSEFPDAPEGVLTRYKAVLVSEQGLAQTARELNLGVYLRLGRGELKTSGRSKSSVLANAMEAVVAAVYLDGGFRAAQTLIHHLYLSRLDKVGQVEQLVDFKTKLQEIVQLEQRVLPRYEIVSVEGPDHARIYSAEVSINDEVIGRGQGRSKKEAEQSAARDAYQETDAAVS